MVDKHLYHASDQLLKVKTVLESHLFGQVRTLFSIEITVTLYDLTNTFFESQAKANTLAGRRHPKEKRSDCPLLTLALVLDQSGFVKHSDIFTGNVSESDTLQTMLTALGTQAV